MRTVFLVSTLMVALALGGANATSPDSAMDSLSEPIADHPGGAAETSTCNATAPDDTNCDTGLHLRAQTGGTVLSHGVTLPMTGYTGTIESKLSWIGGVPPGQGARVFRCNFSSGTFLGCAGSGVFPPMNSAYVHSCTSYNLGTTTLGGTGTFRCTITHN